MYLCVLPRVPSDAKRKPCSEMSEEKKVNYWVITSTEQAYGPWDDYALAYEFGCINLGFDGWVITTT